MQRSLQRHPASPPSPISQIAVEAFRFEDGRVTFSFLATGSIEEVAVPPIGEPARRDELWRHTCFEAFVAPPQGEAYVEINLSPSRAWAAYRFDRYRSGMKHADVAAPDIRPSEHPLLAMAATVALGPLPDLPPWDTWRVGLSAVIEAKDGSRSYWALAHPQGAPDFHHPDCFAAQLAPDASL